MNTMREAFDKAGLPTASVAFAAACHDLARLALNRCGNDTGRAIPVFFGMANAPAFRDRLREFLAEVSGEKNPGDDADHARSVAQFMDVQSSPGTPSNSGDDVDHVRSVAQLMDVPSSPGFISEREEGQRKIVDQGGDASSRSEAIAESGAADDQVRDVDQTTSVAAAPDPNRPASEGHSHSVIHGVADPSPTAGQSLSRIAAATAARQQEVRALCGFYITERQGSKTPIEDIVVEQIDRVMRSIGRRTVSGAVQYNALAILKTKLPAYAPSGAKCSDVFGPRELQAAASAARDIGMATMFVVPRALQQARIGAAS